MNKSTYNQIINSLCPTVIEEFETLKKHENAYQSEYELEKQFIAQLISQGYEYLDFSKINKQEHEQYLLQNLRNKIEELNKIKLSDNEWNKLFNEYIANKQDDQKRKTEKIQKDFIYALLLDNGATKNICLIDKKNVHNNYLQVINQYINIDGKFENRYDVTILVNGLPLIHIELKRRGLQLKEAFNQITRYKHDSFWASHGLFNYVQIFVISNGTFTKYYSNTTRYLHIKKLENQQVKSKTSNSFEFTNNWADAQNKIINDLEDFTKTFFAKHTILNVLTKYCIFTNEQNLIVMRPYQIVATERIINKINLTTHNPKMLGTIDAGDYIWHTTGSGKTVTSFKTAQLAAELDNVAKILFVVDRKDLDYQTMLEYEKFEKGAANATKTTNALKMLLENKDKKIIITTIQKLSNFIQRNNKHDVFNERVVLIFDECHRSQFGEMHKNITKNFKKYNIFGFTGTPIFAKNASIQTTKTLVNNLQKTSLLQKTTEQLFGEKIHMYTIIDAIQDNNVLKFKYSYIQTIKGIKEDIEDEKIYSIDKKAILLSEPRIAMITKYIIDNFCQITYSNKTYSHKQIVNVTNNKKEKITNEIKKINLKGFNSIFAVSCVEAAKKYYVEFKKQLNERNDIKLNVATIFSFNPNENFSDVDDNIFLDDENNESISELDDNSRSFLENAIQDYNKIFQTNWSTTNDGFQNYYKDISMRMKNKEIDILIVVNMFLTGFDAPTLNTLWIDKWLKMHGLIQAFSRTNRILNSVKTHGNIVSFLPLQSRLNHAISLFSDNKANGIIILRKFKDYYYGYTNDYGMPELGYVQILKKLQKQFNFKKLSSNQMLIKEKKEFIKLFGSFLQIRNILLSFVDEFTINKQMISERDLQDYCSVYQDFYDELKREYKLYKQNVVDDIVFQVELIKQIDVNIDYIWNLVVSEHSKNIQDKDLISTLSKILNSSFELRSKKELILDFISIELAENDNISAETIIQDFHNYKNVQKDLEIEKIINKFGLDKELTIKFMKNCFINGEIKTHGLDFTNILPPISRFSKNENRNKIKKEVILEIENYFNKFYNL